jgi:hypothetical protein
VEVNSGEADPAGELGDEGVGDLSGRASHADSQRFLTHLGKVISFSTAKC